MDWITAYIGLGSNVGDRKAAIVRAVDLLMWTPGVRLKELSSLYETEPVGMEQGTEAGMFINAVVGLDVKMSAGELLKVLRGIEAKMGRPLDRRKNEDRVIDMDLLLYGDQHVSEEGLEVPHPRMHERQFVMDPMAEIGPDVVHPTLNKTMAELLRELV